MDIGKLIADIVQDKAHISLGMILGGSMAWITSLQNKRISEHRQELMNVINIHAKSTASILDSFKTLYEKQDGKLDKLIDSTETIKRDLVRFDIKNAEIIESDEKHIESSVLKSTKLLINYLLTKMNKTWENKSEYGYAKKLVDSVARKAMEIGEKEGAELIKSEVSIDAIEKWKSVKTATYKVLAIDLENFVKDCVELDEIPKGLVESIKCTLVTTFMHEFRRNLTIK